MLIILSFDCLHSISVSSVSASFSNTILRAFLIVSTYFLIRWSFSFCVWQVIMITLKLAGANFSPNFTYSSFSYSFYFDLRSLLFSSFNAWNAHYINCENNLKSLWIAHACPFALKTPVPTHLLSANFCNGQEIVNSYSITKILKIIPELYLEFLIILDFKEKMYDKWTSEETVFFCNFKKMYLFNFPFMNVFPACMHVKHIQC